jgi:hypothetical protein
MTNPKTMRIVEEPMEEHISGINIRLTSVSGDVHKVKITPDGKSFSERMKIYPRKVIVRALANGCGVNDLPTVARLDDAVSSGLSRLERARLEITGEKSPKSAGVIADWDVDGKWEKD